MQLQSGTLLQGGKYKIERVLGQGGFGITYLATQVGLNRKVAIKEFFMREYCNRDTDTSHVTVGSEGSRDVVEKFRSKFVKEAQNIACLKHPHIISIYDVFEENGTAYYVMEYLDRGSLAELVKQRGRLSEADALRYIRQIADALRYIHARKMNHLDVKPANILIDDTDGAVLIDFGLSKRYDDEGNQTSTTPVGISHGYAPLEQYKKGGVGTSSPSTDIYSLGATLYKLVTGDTPPDANDINDDGFPAFPSYVSASVAHAIEQAMQPRRKDRPQSIEAFLALLDVDVKEDKETVVIEEIPSISPKEERTPNIAEQSTEKQSLTKKWLWSLLLCVVVIAAFLGVRSYKNQRAEEFRLAEKTRLAVIEQHRLDSIAKVKEAARLAEEAARQEQLRKDSIAKVEESKRIAEEKRREEVKQYYEMGENFYHGRNGKKQDYAEAVKWYRKAAELGHAEAQYNLAMCYETGKGVEKDYTKGAKWHRKAAEQGHLHAQVLLANCYYFGSGVTQDYVEAVKWYRKAAEQGDDFAQYFLGGCYERGKGVTQDYVEAVKWYRKAAVQGYAAAQLCLGGCYESGKGVVQDYLEAVKWYHKAADKGDAGAQFCLAYCYKDGLGVVKDVSKAMDWCRKSANNGYRVAQFILGNCYERGDGVTKDKSEAVKWYRKAAERGHDEAKNALKRLGY